MNDYYSSSLQHRLIQYGERNPGWGNLHIALDDGNLEDSNIDWCLENALKEGDGEAAVLAYWIRQMSLAEREKLYER